MTVCARVDFVVFFLCVYVYFVMCGFVCVDFVMSGFFYV